MAEITKYRADDKRGVDALYRRVFGHDAAESSRLRWDWQYRRNPNNPRPEPEIWIADNANNYVRVFDATVMPPRLKTSVKVRDEPGWITFGIDGTLAEMQRAFDAGDFIGAKTKAQAAIDASREIVKEIEAAKAQRRSA